MTCALQSHIGSEQCVRIRLTIQGTVQGIGFRPFVFRLAEELSLGGWIANTTRGALLELEGTQNRLRAFQKRITTELPLSGNIQAMSSTPIPVIGEQSFSIRPSQWTDQTNSVIAPDLATCEDCLEDINNPLSRRYRYPFTTCSQCGPRFSIALCLPYDRRNTTMHQFVLCDDCQREYDDPSERRFHAETISCPSCGPQVELWNHEGNLMDQREEGLQAASKIVRHGGILAVKGLGGFQLWVNAESSEAVKRLRRRKHRPTKPLAVLFPSLAYLEQHCFVSPEETGLVTSPAAPIALVRKRPLSNLAWEVAPNNPYVGAMLPHTPLHHLLMNDLHMPVIATSGNRSEEPLVIEEKDAVHRLHGIADAFLVHNRPIVRPVDDSIVQVVNDKCLMRRRARGYVPTPLSVKPDSGDDLKPFPILAVGGHLKNTVAVTTGEQIIVSQHIGDLSTPEASNQFERTISDMLTLFHLTPQTIVCDSHPDYCSTRFAHQFAQRHNIPVLQIQHHHAHITSCMAEHGLKEPVLGIAWDGAGYGPDRTIWGGEFLLCNYTSFRRVATLHQFRLPGGEICMREPRRVALSLLFEVFGKEASRMPLPSVNSLGSVLAASLVALLEKDINSPATTSMGRLFDGISSILGLQHISTFEGEAAMALEFASEQIENEIRQPTHTASIPFIGNTDDTWIVDWRPHFREIVLACLQGKPVSQIAAEFHHYLAGLILQMAEKVGCPIVVLAGGVFQNAQLTSLAKHRLRSSGYRVYTNTQFPPNDGGLSIGQAIIAQHIPELERTESKDN